MKNEQNMKKKDNWLWIVMVVSLSFIIYHLSFSPARAQNTFQIGDKTFLLNGKPFVVKAAEVHYPRIPRPYWEHRIQMCKALGMNLI